MQIASGSYHVSCILWPLVPIELADSEVPKIINAIALPAMEATMTARRPCLSAIELHSREVKNWVMKKTEIRLPAVSFCRRGIAHLSRDRLLLLSQSSWGTLRSGRSLVISDTHELHIPSTIFNMNGVQRLADRSSDSIACRISRSTPDTIGLTYNTQHRHRQPRQGRGICRPDPRYERRQLDLLFIPDIRHAIIVYNHRRPRAPSRPLRGE